MFQKNDSSLYKGAFDGQEQASALPRRRLRRIVRNSLWLSLTHYATPPFPQKSRSARLFGCKRPHDGSLSLPTFADCGTAAGCPYGRIYFPLRAKHPLLFTLLFSLFTLLCPSGLALAYAIAYSIKILGGFAEGGNGVCIRSVYTHLEMQMHAVRRLNRN